MSPIGRWVAGVGCCRCFQSPLQSTDLMHCARLIDVPLVVYINGVSCADFTKWTTNHRRHILPALRRLISTYCFSVLVSLKHVFIFFISPFSPTGMPYANQPVLFVLGFFLFSFLILQVSDKIWYFVFGCVNSSGHSTRPLLFFLIFICYGFRRCCFFIAAAPTNESSNNNNNNNNNINNK